VTHASFQGPLSPYREKAPLWKQVKTLDIISYIAQSQQGCGGGVQDLKQPWFVFFLILLFRFNAIPRRYSLSYIFSFHFNWTRRVSILKPEVRAKRQREQHQNPMIFILSFWWRFVFHYFSSILFFYFFIAVDDDKCDPSSLWDLSFLLGLGIELFHICLSQSLTKTFKSMLDWTIIV